MAALIVRACTSCFTCLLLVIKVTTKRFYAYTFLPSSRACAGVFVDRLHLWILLLHDRRSGLFFLVPHSISSSSTFTFPITFLYVYTSCSLYSQRVLLVLRLRPGICGTFHRAPLLRAAPASPPDLRRSPGRAVGQARRGKSPCADYASALHDSLRLLPGRVRSRSARHRSTTDRIGSVWERPRVKANACSNAAARCVIYFVYVSVVSPSSPCRATEIVQARSLSFRRV